MTRFTEITGEELRLPVFDVLHLKRVMAADQYRAGAIVSILKNVISNGCTPVDEARAAYRRRQPAQASHVIHNLKGCIANLGGRRLLLAAEELQNALEGSSPSAQCYVLFDAVELELTAFLQEAQMWLQHTAHLPTEHHITELNPGLLNQLKQHLEERNLRACDTFDKMRPSLQANLSEDQFNHLVRAIDNLDFTMALSHLSQVH